MEGNLCWNCRHINICTPIERPKLKDGCLGYEYCGRQISQTTIAEYLGVSRCQVEYIIRAFGAPKIVDLLQARGVYARYEQVRNYIKFYEVSYVLSEVKVSRIFITTTLNQLNGILSEISEELGNSATIKEAILWMKLKGIGARNTKRNIT